MRQVHDRNLPVARLLAGNAGADGQERGGLALDAGLGADSVAELLAHALTRKVHVAPELHHEALVDRSGHGKLACKDSGNRIRLSLRLRKRVSRA
jgi:hypothetical protein